MAVLLCGAEPAASAQVDVQGTTWVTTGNLNFKIKKLGSTKGVTQAALNFFSNGSFSFALQIFGDQGQAVDILNFGGTYAIDSRNKVEMFPDETSLARGIGELIDETVDVENRRGEIELQKVRMKVRAKQRKDGDILTLRLKLKFNFFVEVEEDFVVEFFSRLSFNGKGPRA